MYKAFLILVMLAACGDDGGGDDVPPDGPDPDVQGPAKVPIAAGVSVGVDHACTVLHDGRMLCWGDNSNGQIGDGTRMRRFVPTQVGIPDWKFAQVSVARANSLFGIQACAIGVDGALLCWGDQPSPFPGGPTEGHDVPTLIGTDRLWTQVSVGAEHVCAIQETGALFCFGENGNGQLGDGTTTDAAAPQQVGTDLDWARVSAGSGHTCATRTDGSLWCWGVAAPIIVGPGTPPTRVGTDSDWVSLSSNLDSCGIRANGTLWCWQPARDPGSTVTPAQVEPDTDWSAIARGASTFCATKTDGRLFCWGSQLVQAPTGNGTTVPSLNPTQVGTDTDWDAPSVGTGNQCALKRDTDELHCWGFAAFGMLGNGVDPIKDVPTRIDAAVTDYTQVSAGGTSTCARRQDASLWCWGSNGVGQLASGPGAAKIPRQGPDTDWVQLDVGGEFACGLRTSGAVTCWGDNTLGQHGGIVNVATLKLMDSISVGASHACGTSNGSLLCWGGGTFGQLGDGGNANQMFPVDLGTGFVSVAAGTTHTCAIRANQAVQCTGDNFLGQLGDGTFTQHRVFAATSPARVASTISAGSGHSCAIDAGQLFCWGDNSFGKLGTGAAGIPVLAPIRIGADSDWALVSTGGSHTCGVRTGGTLWCWGDGTFGAIGQGARDEVHAPLQIGADSDWAQVTAGGAHTCAVKSSGALFCWGANLLGEVGDATAYEELPVPATL